MLVKDLLIVVPCYNESKSLEMVITDLRTNGFENIVVIDDGSHDESREIAVKNNVTLLKHPINIGLGGALSTGLIYAKENNYTYAITFDSDGQHKSEDAINIYKELIKGVNDIVIGSRLEEMKKNKLSRYLMNRVGDFILLIMHGIKFGDTQSGLRGFNRKAIENIEISSSKYECSSEIIVNAHKSNLTLSSIPIKSIYTDYSIKKGQKLTNSLYIAFKLFMRTLE